MNSIEEWALRPGGLVVRLRELRESVGLTGSALAERLGWQQPKVSKIENGRQLPSAADIEAWAKACGASHDVIGELQQLRDEASVLHREWRRVVRGGQVVIQKDYDELVRRAKLIRNAELTTVPGLLQTPDYARIQLMQAVTYADADPAQVDAAVESRMRRQTVLYDTDKRFEFVMVESGLHLLYGEPEMMVAQLDRLLGVTFERPNLWFGIIPFHVTLPAVPQDRVLIVDNEAFVEDSSGEWTHRDRDRVLAYAQAIDRLIAQSVTGERARELIVKAMRALNAARRG